MDLALNNLQWLMCYKTKPIILFVLIIPHKKISYLHIFIDFYCKYFILILIGIKVIFSDISGSIKEFVDIFTSLYIAFTYLGSSVSSTEKDIDTRLTKAWTAIDRLSIIWKSDLPDKMKRSFFQAAVVSILLYGCTTWTLTKRLDKKLDGNYTRMLRAILNKSW